MNPVPTLLIHRTRLFRQGLVRLLEATRYHVVAEYASIEEALTPSPAPIAPKLIILDPSGDSLQTIPQLRVAMPESRLVMLTSNPHLERLRQAGIAGSGLPDQGIGAGELTSALDRVMDGQILFPPLWRRWS